VTALRPSGAIAYSTFLGDTHYDEANAIAVDRRGRAVVTGRTSSPNYPRARALRPPVDAGAFVTKLDRSGSSLVFSAVLGGDDRANHGNTGLGVAVDQHGATYVAGVTNAAAFPTTSHALQPRIGGGGDAFLTKVDAAGRSVVYSTYLGGSADDSARAVAADAAGNAYLAGMTSSRDMPLRSAPQPINAGGADAFVAKLGPRGGALGYATYLGGPGDDGATAIALGARGEAYVTGRLGSLGPAGGALSGGGAASRPAGAFVRRLSSSGRSIAYATAIGGAGGSGLGIAADRFGAFAVTGIADDHDGGGFVTAIAPSAAARERRRPPPPPPRSPSRR
jgi:hypothetical protein